MFRYAYFEGEVWGPRKACLVILGAMLDRGGELGSWEKHALRFLGAGVKE